MRQPAEDHCTTSPVAKSENLPDAVPVDDFTGGDAEAVIPLEGVIYSKSPIRPDHELKVGELFTDSFEYLHYNTYADTYSFALKKDGEIFSVYDGRPYGSPPPEFAKGDMLESNSFSLTPNTRP